MKTDCADSGVRAGSGADDHDLSGLDEGGGGDAFLERELAGGVGGDDGSHLLLINGEYNLGQQALNLNLRYGADELIASTDARRSKGLCRREEFGEGGDGDAMVAPGSFDCLNAAGEDPVFERRIAHTKLFSCLARGEEPWRNHRSAQMPPRKVL
jgi:hypothetical protein